MDILTSGRRVRMDWGRDGGCGGNKGTSSTWLPCHRGWGPSPGICVSASSDCPGRSWTCGLRWPRGSAPIPPARAPDAPTPSSGAPRAAAAHDSLRSASVWPDACCHPTPLKQTRLTLSHGSWTFAECSRLSKSVNVFCCVNTIIMIMPVEQTVISGRCHVFLCHILWDVQHVNSFISLKIHGMELGEENRELYICSHCRVSDVKKTLPSNRTACTRVYLMSK